MNHLVLNLRSYSDPHHGLAVSTGSPLPDLVFHYSEALGNIGAPLDFSQGIDTFIEDNYEIDCDVEHGATISYTVSASFWNSPHSPSPLKTQQVQETNNTEDIAMVLLEGA